MVLVVSEWSSRQLNPSGNEVLFNARFELKHFPFNENFFIRINFNFMHLINRFLRWFHSGRLLQLLLRLPQLLLRRFFHDGWRRFLHRSTLHGCCLSGSTHICWLVMRFLLDNPGFLICLNHFFFDYLPDLQFTLLDRCIFILNSLGDFLNLLLLELDSPLVSNISLNSVLS